MDPQLFDFTLLNLESHTVNACQLSIQYYQTHRAHVDYHEFSAILDYMHSLGIAEVYNFTNDGMTIYQHTHPVTSKG